MSILENIKFPKDIKKLSIKNLKILNDELRKFSETLEKVCIRTVEKGHMTKDLALLVGPQQTWLNTQSFIDKVDENLQKKMS